MLNKIKCFASKFKRLRYFHGMLMTETDFQDEQTYFREKNKLHNRIHGYGVVWGLNISPKKDEEDEYTTKINIEPGFAIDCDGKEIIVCRNQDFDLHDKIVDMEQHGEFHQDDECDETDPSKIYIGIKYCECNAEPVQQYTSECSTDDLKPQFSRVKEGFSIVLFTAEELPPASESVHLNAEDYCMNPNRYCPGSRPCYVDNHVIILGSIHIDDADQMIEPDDIDNYDKRKILPTTSTLNSTLLHWEYYKQALMPAVCEAAGWKDISVVIGKKVNIAKCILTHPDMGMNVTDEITIKQLVQRERFILYLRNAQISIPWVAVGSNIALITDNDSNYVLFAFIDPIIEEK